MISFATSTCPPSKGSSKSQRFLLLVLFVFLVCLFGLISILNSAAEPQSWYRNWTGEHLTLEEPPTVFRVGSPSDFPDVGVYTHRWSSDGVWIVRLPGSKLVALSTFCTYDGCTTDFVETESLFKCPCCGSEFHMEGTHAKGPAVRPLERFKIYQHRGSIMVSR